MLTFSIVIPHLNQARFLAAALESIRHQNAPVNVVIMDGGSRDDFKRVAENYQDVVCGINSGHDLGQADAIYRGIEKVGGDIVTWLNADDYYFPQILQKIARLFEKHPTVDVIYGDAVHVKPDGAFLSYFPGIENFNIPRLFRSCYICQPACFVRRRAYEEIGGLDRRLRYTMDWDLWCRLAIEGKSFLRVNELLAAVRYYKGTKTLSGDRARYNEIWRIQRIYGKHRIPTAWPGFYWFDLACKENRTLFEKMSFSLLQGARLLKKKMKGAKPDYIHGFQRWENNVTGVGLIRFPWYGESASGRIMLDVEPHGATLRVCIGGANFVTFIAKRGRIAIPVDFKKGSSVDLSISSLSAPVWKITDLSFEID